MSFLFITFRRRFGSEIFKQQMADSPIINTHYLLPQTRISSYKIIPWSYEHSRNNPAVRRGVGVG
jgi:hypothetical protein